MHSNKTLLTPILASLLAMIIASAAICRQISDFNYDWKFHLGDLEQAEQSNFDDSEWRSLRLPHDWSIEEGYAPMLDLEEDQNLSVEKSENDNNLPTGIESQKGDVFRRTAASTGFVPGGIGWYRKTFEVDKADQGKHISIEFDGVYTRSKVWINGHLLGYRPNGYISFTYDLSPYLNYGGKNVIAVRADHSNYVDSRWYTGSGIYRNVRLVTKAATHIPQWGVSITTPEVTSESASVAFAVDTYSENTLNDATLELIITDSQGKKVAQSKATVASHSGISTTSSALKLSSPKLWSIDSPELYTAQINLLVGGKTIDSTTEKFGIRTAEFDSNKGFVLNGEQVKIKGVNLHHDAGAVGAAVPIDVWRRRLELLKSIGCNAIRTAHNPYAPEFLDLCDEMGFVVVAEFFDEWNEAKDKNATQLGSVDAPDSWDNGYSEYFDEWAERDLKDNIYRDRNHPSIIMWSIGNEIEWTYKYYTKAYHEVNGKVKYYEFEPNYDPAANKAAFDKVAPENDELVRIATMLAKWTRETDPTRAVTAGQVLPVVGFASGYSQLLDVNGFNYRNTEYDGAHAAYPDAKIVGSENNGNWEEWKAVADRDFVAGIFTWTGFAYQGEAGPYPKKGLNISFFDFAGFKTARGHFFECLWEEDPKVYIGTCPLADSEFRYDEEKGFSVELDTFWLRRWTWYDTRDSWNYEPGEKVVVQGYSNCEEVELFLNGKSFGKQSVWDHEDHFAKWLVPFQSGELKIVGYNNGKIADQYTLETAGALSQITLSADRKSMDANQNDVAHIELELRDKNGVRIPNADCEVTFELSGNAQLIGVDNGSEYNVQNAKADKIETYNGRALAIIQAGSDAGSVTITAKAKGITSNEIQISLAE
ncbi:glycoside hydrolase family 2 TIM barrel-domain containing protein [Pelagicoccus mobilis]|uniref:DUF4982 domain-containing protein n=1 Tax=Pelagicoccus mobilis TaxID=415221 RepID=A0A934RZF4_9BACT|nr:glycoside hydrolase family 2 TIM barrel-domain containing protein [Pelagicoccus mobilis]MBK1879133.1 DUF4982 domain-containing protein [Pelagicoccus mobilis]